MLRDFVSLANSSFLPRLSFLNMEGNYTMEGIAMLKSRNHFDECCIIMVDEENSENEYGSHSDSCSSDEASGSERELTESDED